MRNGLIFAVAVATVAILSASIWIVPTSGSPLAAAFVGARVQLEFASLEPGWIAPRLSFPVNHNPTRRGKPKHLVESLNWQCYWFDRFLNGNHKATPPDAF